MSVCLGLLILSWATSIITYVNRNSQEFKFSEKDTFKNQYSKKSLLSKLNPVKSFTDKTTWNHL